MVLSGSSTTETGRHDIAEILLKVALNTKNQIKSKINLTGGRNFLCKTHTKVYYCIDDLSLCYFCLLVPSDNIYTLSYSVSDLVHILCILLSHSFQSLSKFVKDKFLHVF